MTSLLGVYTAGLEAVSYGDVETYGKSEKNRPVRSSHALLYESVKPSHLPSSWHCWEHSFACPYVVLASGVYVTNASPSSIS